MNQKIELGKYLSNGVEKIVKNAMKATLSNPRESIFMGKFALATKSAASIRKEYEQKGIHIPPFLIASITDSCNLQCVGCYSRANHACHDIHESKTSKIMTVNQWNKVFLESREAGISFILLAGGEPMIRKDIILEAAKHKDILFPIFTNGTMLDHEYLEIFHKNRNLVPVISVEGEKEVTDQRRGEGMYDKIMESMAEFDQKGIIYGASITINRENMKRSMEKEFLDQLYQKGCKVVFIIEYVPVDPSTMNLAPNDDDREWMMERLEELRTHYEDMLFIAFPGDEKTSGGCLAAGRGFFHISAYGAAEPCPFSPYSDTNVFDHSLVEVLSSPLFKGLVDEGLLMEDHAGGCVLHERKERVEALLLSKQTT